jgi:protoheme IX farnesyltransferase
VLGVIFLWHAYQLRSQARAGGRITSLRLFRWSNTYLSLLFLALAVDALVLH